MSRCRLASVGALSLNLSFGGPAGVRLIVSWWQPKWQCPSDLLSLFGILAAPAKVASEIDKSLLNAHLVCFSRHGSNFVYDCTCARPIIDRTRLLCLVFFLPESARGPRHLVIRPGPLPFMFRTLACSDLGADCDDVSIEHACQMPSNIGSRELSKSNPMGRRPCCEAWALHAPTARITRTRTHTVRVPAIAF